MKSSETVTLLRSTVNQVLEALFCTDSDEGSPAYELELEAVKALREALKQPQAEPVAVLAFYEGEREPCLLSWNRLPAGEHRLYLKSQV